MKSLPEALRLEEEGEGQGHTLEVEGPASAPGKAAATRLPTRQPPAQAERSHGGPVEYVNEPSPLVPHQLRNRRGGNCHSELDSLETAFLTCSSVSLQNVQHIPLIAFEMIGCCGTRFLVGQMQH